MQHTHILVADDDAFYRRKIALFLNACGISCTIVDSGVDLVKEIIAHSEKYACVFTDIHMEAMTGIEAASMVRSRFSDLPIVIMTGDDSLETEIQARSVGITYYLKKPFGEKELMGVIAHIAPWSASGDYAENSYC